MSYQQRILKDNPLGYWTTDENIFLNPDALQTLKSTYFNTEEDHFPYYWQIETPDVYAWKAYDTSNGIFVNGIRTLNHATLGQGAITNGISPLVMGGGNGYALIQSDLTSYLEIPNAYNIFYKGTEKKDFCIEFWMSLEALDQTSKYMPILNIENILDLSIKDNLFELSVNDPATGLKKYGYVEVDNFDPQLYVVLSYSDRVFSISVNGNNVSSVQMDKTYYFNNTYSSPPSFIFAPKGPTVESKIIIDSIAVYNYKLSILQMQNHMIWALTDKTSVGWILANNGGYMEPTDENGRQENYYIYTKDSEWNQGYLKNCLSKDGILSAKYIPELIKYYSTSELDLSVSYPNGLEVGKDSSLLWKNFNNDFSINSDSITLSVKPMGEGAFLSMTGFDFGQLILRYNASNQIELYSPDTDAISIVISATSYQWHDIAIFFNKKVMTLKVGSTTETYTHTSDFYTPSSNLYLGNAYIVNSQNLMTHYTMIGNLKNFTILKNDNQAQELGNGWIKAELLSDYNISQYSQWYGQIIPKSTGNIIGSRIHWGSSSHHIRTFVSLDNETWTEVAENISQIPGLTLGQSQPLFYVRFDISTPDSSINRPSVEFLELITYSKMYIDSKGYHFSLQPYAENTSNSYILRPNDFNVLSRSTNMGIYFQESANGGAAILTPTSPVETIEFWFKVHSSTTDTINYIMKTTSIDLSYDESLNLHLDGLGWINPYLNGQPLVGTPSLIVDEIYHFIVTRKAASSDLIYLNSASDNTYSGNTSFGRIAMYGTNPFISDSVALTQYNRYLGVNQYSASDSSTITISDEAKVVAAKWETISSALV